MTETDIDIAKSPGVFNFEQFLMGTSYPTQDAVVFTDANSVNKIIQLQQKRGTLEVGNKSTKVQRTLDQDVAVAVSPEIELINAEIGELDAKVAASALVFKLQGMSPKDVNEISAKHFIDKTKDYANTDEEKARDLELIAASIVSVQDAEGNVDPAPMTPERVQALKDALLTGEYHKLVQGVSHINMTGALFDQAVDAPFLSRRSNLAG